MTNTTRATQYQPKMKVSCCNLRNSAYEVIDMPDGHFNQRKAMMESQAKIVTAAFEKSRR